MVTAIVFLPLLGALIAGFFRHQLKDKGTQFVTAGFMVIAAILSWVVFLQFMLGDGQAYTLELFRWVSSGDFKFSWALRIDTLTAVMFIVVNTVSCVVHIYSIGYMHHDPHVPRFMAYLSLFTFMMLMLVSADNLVQLFFGWEGVGLASYLLIGFWFKKPSANKAAMKAFLVNRVGDIGFALGIFVIFMLTGSVQFDEIFARITNAVGQEFAFLGLSFDAITIACLLLFLGAMGKSAQLGLHTWLPDAMEGPTPVSALIHAATMVTAGVFMLCRLSPVFEYSQTALDVVTIIGASTAFFAATIGLTQNDIKRVIAYSTCSQLGYMFFAIGVSAYPAAMFHLTTHAFFKALLFLGAGSVIHAMSDEQDMRNMGGIWRKIPFTYAMMWIGSLALAGVPFFAGYYSKDIVLEAAFAAHSGVGAYAFWLGIAAALLTAFYSWRLLFMTFHGTSRADEQTLNRVHESPLVMTLPLGILAIGAILSGALFYDHFVGNQLQEFWQDSILILSIHQALEHAHHVPLWVKLAPLVVGVIGIIWAYICYIKAPDLPQKLANKFSFFYQLSFNKWWFDELYDCIFVKPSMALGRYFWKVGDEQTIDHFGPNGVSSLMQYISGRVSLLQTGYIYHYCFAFVIAIIVLLAIIIA
jgi:NADH-quinone oxidoreductase subunit L